MSAQNPPWGQELGSHLLVHDAHSYLAGDILEPTEFVLQGQTVIGLYFSADWCPPCQVFTPLLKQLHSSKQAHCSKANRNIQPFEVVLVLGCRDHTATNCYFSAMPWTAMTHAEAVGKRGQDLQNRFGIRATPALVLLDREGVVLCQNVQRGLREDPRGTNFPWQDPLVAPCLPQVGFDLGLPEGTRLTTPLKRPLGRPPLFTPGKPTQAQNSQYVKEAAIAHRDHGLSLCHQRLGASLAKTPGNTTQDRSAAEVVPAEEMEDRGQAQGDRALKKGRATKTATQQLDIPQPEQASTPIPNRQPTMTISMQNTKDPDDVPRPRPPPPKPNSVDWASPSMSSRAVDALAM